MSPGTSQLVSHLLDCLPAPQPLTGLCQVIVPQTAKAQSREQLVQGPVPGTAATGRPDERKGSYAVGATSLLQKQSCPLCRRDILATCFSTAKDCIIHWSFLPCTILTCVRVCLFFSLTVEKALLVC